MTKIARSCALRLAAMALTEDWGQPDRVCWLRSSSGKFSTASAFKWALQQPSDLSIEDIFVAIWSVNVPERIQFFLWLVGCGRILTNVERTRRHMAIDARERSR